MGTIAKVTCKNNLQKIDSEKIDLEQSSLASLGESLLWENQG
jgi:hypothetical protein